MSWPLPPLLAIRVTWTTSDSAERFALIYACAFVV